jgi:hypothetical protein
MQRAAIMNGIIHQSATHRGGVPCRLAVAPPLHCDAFSFDAWSKIEIAADNDRSSRNENVICGQQTSEPFFAGK